MNPYYEAADLTIYHGDCRDVLPTLRPCSVDLLLTDPPYGVSWNSGYGSMGGLLGDDGSLDVVDALRLALRALQPMRHLYVFGPADLTGLLGNRPTAELIWDKGKMSTGDLSLPWGNAHERITFAVWHPAPSMADRGGLTARLRRGSVLRVPKTNNGRGALLHPTEKPPMLMRMLIEASSLHDETVLDPFMGAGSVLVAARQEGRRAIGIEIEERYCEIAAKRLAQEVLDFGPSSTGTPY